MKITTRSRYGTRMMVELAINYNKGPIQIGQIASKQNLPVKYLEQLIIPLKQAGLIKSIRGPRGGHMLAKSPDKITIWDLVTILDGEDTMTPCVGNPKLCKRSDICPTRDVWNMVTKAVKQKLKSITLSDLAKRDQSEID